MNLVIRVVSGLLLSFILVAGAVYLGGGFDQKPKSQTKTAYPVPKSSVPVYKPPPSNPQDSDDSENIKSLKLN